MISIHALREEGDWPTSVTWGRTTNFYPRPPRGGRHAAPLAPAGYSDFYPRPPRGGRPARRRFCRRLTGNFYPRPPRGGRRPQIRRKRCHGQISIHALREEGDTARQKATAHGLYFYPRPPRGGRPLFCSFCGIAARDFYPRPPRGGRLWHIVASGCYYSFLSTPSARRATEGRWSVCSHP